MSIRIRLRDGRVGRDPSKVDENGLGEILGETDVDEPLDLGDKIRVNGEDLFVIGYRETLSSDSWVMDVSVGEAAMGG